MKNKNNEIVSVCVKKITVYEDNAKVHSEEQINKIAQSISQFGWDVPIVLDKGKVIIKGHGRYLAAKQLKLRTVPCIIRGDLSEQDIIAARIADNKVAESPWDSVKLVGEIGKLNVGGYDLDLTGWSKVELTKMSVNLTEKISSIDKRLPEVREIIVMCDSESQQEQLYKQFTKRGLTCRVLTL